MDISVVIPLLNEADSLRELYDRIAGALAPLGRSWEVIFINDGSTDGSMDVLRSLHAEKDNVSVLVVRPEPRQVRRSERGLRRGRGRRGRSRWTPTFRTTRLSFQQCSNSSRAGTTSSPAGRRSATTRCRSGSRRSSTTAVTARLSGRAHPRHELRSQGLPQDVVKTIRVYGELHRYTPVLAHWSGFRVTEVVGQAPRAPVRPLEVRRRALRRGGSSTS